MSCYTLDEKEIEIIINWAADTDVSVYHGNARFKIADKPAEYAKILMDANYNSVNHRYKSNDKPPKINFVRRCVIPTYTPAEIAKGVSCYEYQSCETPIFEESFAYKICHAIKEKLIEKLPGYDKATWGIDTSKIEQTTIFISLGDLVK